MMRTPSAVSACGLAVMVVALVSGAAQSAPEAQEVPPPKITQTGIGLFRLGEAIPAPLLAAERKPESIYRAAYYGDAQPLEGFYFRDPPVFVVLEGGAFEQWGTRHLSDNPPPARIRNKTIRLAREGKLRIEMIVITDSRLQTESGVSVGESYSEVRAAYPGAGIAALPGMWEEPSCILFEGNLNFFFSACDEQSGFWKLDPNGRLLRIVVKVTNLTDISTVPQRVLPK
jgi:hypothetical protein